MITKTRYVFDLDNTLVYTDALNNESYNHALKQVGLVSIEDCKRITRNVVFSKYPDLNNIQKNEIIELKQKYFASNLNNTIPNYPLLLFLKAQNAEMCMLWTSAEETRVLVILEHYKIRNAFKKILLSNKLRVIRDTETICEDFECASEHLIFYEDNLRVIQDLKQLKMNVISVG